MTDEQRITQWVETSRTPQAFEAALYDMRKAGFRLPSHIVAEVRRRLAALDAA